MPHETQTVTSIDPQHDRPLESGSQILMTVPHKQALNPKEIEERRSRMMERNGERRICRRKERYKTIRFQENANRKISDYKINEFPKFLKLLHKRSKR